MSRAARRRRRLGRALAVAVLLVLPTLAAGVASASPAAAAPATFHPDGVDGSLYRFYRGFFVREPDPGGYRIWDCLLRKGRVTLGTVADAFVASSEFHDRYGSPGDDEFLDLAYRNLFDRLPDAGGRRYWLDQMAAGLSPGLVMAHLADSAEFRSVTADGSPPPVDERRMQAATCGDTLLAWISEGLPDGFADSVAAIDQVTEHTVVSGDLIRLLATHDRTGNRVDAAPAGWAWPIDAFAIDPASYASFQHGPAADVLASLRPGGAVLTESSARLRHLGVGGTLTFEGGTVTVTGIVDDRSGGGGEVLLHRADAERLGVHRPRFVLVHDTDRLAVEAAIRDATPSGRYLSLRSEAEARYLRHADRVDPQIHVKLAFGEFLFQDAGGRDIRIDPAWVAANIVTERVPLLGRVRCHRAVVPRVRAAMQHLVDTGHGGAVDPADYAGCQYARRIQATQGLSRHSWGIALDLNIAGDPRGSYETQHPALVAAMRSLGFYWGGDWEYPDPGHYEAISPLDR